MPAVLNLLAPGLALCLAAGLAAASTPATHAPARAMPASQPANFYSTPFERTPDVKTLTALGRALFREPGLSASGTMSCATCHDPAHAYGPANALAVQPGGADGREAGLRAVPSLTYHQDMPPFSEHFFDNDGNDSEDQGPTGGLDWDGRASSAHQQAAGPLLSPFEMANADTLAVVDRLAASPSAPAFRAAFGPHVFDDPQHAWNGLAWALEVFQQDPASFYPYTSKYDAFLRGRATLAAAERRGLDAFEDPARGNCASCHPSAPRRGAFPQFTDHGFVALGVPRNRAIPANADPRHFDLGLCGPLRADLAGRAAYCGLFRTPSLRNVALRPVFFHNGVYHRLEDVLRFYAERDSDPQRLYARDPGDGTDRYDDLPARYDANVNRDRPFGARPGAPPSLTQQEQADIIAFLRTLTDGWTPPAPDARPGTAGR